MRYFLVAQMSLPDTIPEPANTEQVGENLWQFDIRKHLDAKLGKSGLARQLHHHQVGKKKIATSESQGNARCTASARISNFLNFTR